MVKWIVSLALFALAGCATEEAAPANLEGFESTKLSWSSTQNVKKYNAQKQLTEEGYIANGQKQGQWISYDPGKSEIKSMAHYVDGRLQGTYLGFSSRGQIETRIQYFDDQYHGPYVKYRFGRPTEESNYVNGKLEGLYKEFHNNGKLQKEIQYKDGKIHGFYRFYDDEGNITLEYQYENGEKISGGIIEEAE